MMPSMTADDDHPFDPRATSCIGMGIVADLLAAAGRTAQRQPARLRRGGRRLPVSPPRTRWMSRMDWTARLAGYMNWMGRCCCSAWITPPILPSTWASMRRARYRRKKYVTLLKEAAYPGSITLRLITAARTSALSMAGWKAKGCSAAGRWAARRRGWSDRAM